MDVNAESLLKVSVNDPEKKIRRNGSEPEPYSSTTIKQKCQRKRKSKVNKVIQNARNQRRRNGSKDNERHSNVSQSDTEKQRFEKDMCKHECKLETDDNEKLGDRNLQNAKKGGVGFLVTMFVCRQGCWEMESSVRLGMKVIGFSGGQSKELFCNR